MVYFEFPGDQPRTQSSPVAAPKFTALKISDDDFKKVIEKIKSGELKPAFAIHSIPNIPMFIRNGSPSIKTIQGADGIDFKAGIVDSDHKCFVEGACGKCPIGNEPCPMRDSYYKGYVITRCMRCGAMVGISPEKGARALRENFRCLPSGSFVAIDTETCMACSDAEHAVQVTEIRKS